MIGLSFSGGGTRASAFAYGAIAELAAHESGSDGTGKSLVDEVVFVSGVSGGSIPAVYFALHGAKTVPAFRDNFLYKDPQSSFNTSVSLFSLLSVLGGGLNSKTGFQHWLDKNLLHDATFGDLTRDNAPILWVNASDIFNDTIFTFDAATFAALCSDLGAFKLSEAVSAASAVPGVFSPIVIENFAGQCDYEEPDWIGRAIESPGRSLVLGNQARTFRRYQNLQENRYLKLYDGGVTDNLGIYGLVTYRERHESLIEPMTPRRAVNVKDLLFIVVNAGTRPRESFLGKIEGPNGIRALEAVMDTLMATATARTRDDFFREMRGWQDDIVKFRCGLDEQRLRELIDDRQGWDCKDVQFHILDLSFDQVMDRELRAELNRIPTAYVLPQDQTDMLVKTAGELLRNNPQFKKFLDRVQ
ncbi:MAG: patatin-like phospholipase family protein [Alphaproteobacteria bacterium]|nr:patatin-like phospholipase family protein [Alphaproteobacteria bacterium]